MFNFITKILDVIMHAIEMQMNSYIFCVFV